MSAALRFNRQRSRHGAAFAALCVASLLMYGVNNALMMLSPLFVSNLGFGMAAAGMQGSAFVAAAVAFRFLLISRASRVPLSLKGYLVVSAASFCLSCIAFSACQSFWQFFIVRIVQSVGLALYWPCALSAVISLSEAEHMGRRLGVYRFCTALSLAVGPALAFAVVSMAGYAAAFCGMAVASAAAGVIAALLPRGKAVDDTAESRAASASGPAKGTAVFMAVTLVVSLGHGLMTNFSSVYASVAYPGLNAGVCLTCFSLGGIAASPLAGYAADRISWRALLFAGMLALGFGICLMGVSDDEVFLLVASAVAGFGSSASTVCILRGIAERFEGPQRTSALGWQQNCVDVGIMASSGCFGLLLDLSPAQSAVFTGWGMASCVVSCLLFACARSK